MHGIIAQLLAEMPHVHAEIHGLFSAVGSPDLIQNVSVREHLAGISNEQQEECVFGRGKPYLLASSPNGPCPEVHSEPPKPERGLILLPGPATQSNS